MTELTLKIDGMTCGHCVASVSRALQRIPGLVVDEVTLGEASVRVDSNTVSREQVARAIEAEGYRVREDRP